MAKKKEKDKKSRPARQINMQFQDLTAERYFNSQFSKAESLYEAGKFSDALHILEPLTERYPNRPNLFDLLGLSYASAGFLLEGEEAFERAVALSPVSSTLSRFNLAQLFVLLNLYFLAYEQSELIDCYQLAQESGDTANTTKCREFREACQELVEKAAADNQRDLNEFLDTALSLERGRLALLKQDYEAAQEHFQKATQLDPEIPAAFNNLALVYLLNNQLDKSFEQSQYVLDKLDPQNLTALSNLVRLTAIRGEREKAEEYLTQLHTLPRPTIPNDMVKLAEAYAALELDQPVYDLLQPVLAKAKIREEMDGASYEQAVTFGVVAAANLGQNMQAMRILREAKDLQRPTLLERTLYALENGERGPRPAGRFFYFDPVAAYPPAAAFFQEIAEDLAEHDSSDYREGLQKFFVEFGESALEVASYKYWIDRDPELVADLLTQALLSGAAEAETLVRRLAFTRAGDDLQRLTAAKILAEQGLIAPDDKLKMWIGQRQIIATLDVLSQKYKAEAARDRTGERNYDQATAIMLNEALEAMRLGDADKAISTYTKILDKNPKVKQAYQNLAALLSGKGEVERAISYIQQALRVDYEYVHAQIALAQLWLVAGDLEKTSAQLDSLESKLDGYYVDELDAYYYVKLSLYRKQEKFSEMAEVAHKLLELDPQNKIALEVLAQSSATSDQNPSPIAPASGESS